MLVLDGTLGAGDAEVEARVDAEVGLRLRQRRWMMGMTKKQLADPLGIGVEEIQDYEAGKRHIGTGRMWHLAAALEMPMSYFFGEAGEQAEDGSMRVEAPRVAPETALARTA